MNKEEFLKMCQAETVSDLDDEMIVYYYAEYYGSPDIVSLYEENNEEENKAFAKDIRKCLDSGDKIEINRLYKEPSGTTTENLHSLSYSIVKV